MRLMTRFLAQIGSKYRPDEIWKSNNLRFTDPIELVFPKDKVVYNGYYLGQNKKWYQPSSLLLQKLGEEDGTKKESYKKNFWAVNVKEGIKCYSR